MDEELPVNHCPTCGDDLQTDGQFAVCSEHGRILVTVTTME